MATADDNQLTGIQNRRQVLSNMARQSGLVMAACGCSCCATSSRGLFLQPPAAQALAQITAPPLDAVKKYDLPRKGLQDAAFAQGMAVGMRDYEREAFPIKKRLFGRLFQDYLDKIRNDNDDDEQQQPSIVEVGMGSFPNSLYYGLYSNHPQGLDIIGVDPNDRMEGYARDSAQRAGLVDEKRSNNKNSPETTSAKKNSLRIVHGVSEALPFPDQSVDAVVCTLTLCSVVDPARSVAEIRRVLKPGGKFLFWEHVLSETNPALAQQQILLTPTQVKRADGCHLDRRTGETLRQAGFAKLDLEYLELQNFGFLNPTVCGIATA